MRLFVGAKGLVVHKGKVLLLQQSSRYEDSVRTKDGKWDVPGGRIEPEEAVRAGLVREVKEESGLDVIPGELMGIFDGFPEIRGERCHVVRVYFLCEAMTTEVALSQDHDTYAWVDPDDVDDRVLLDDIQEMLEKYANMRRNI